MRGSPELLTWLCRRIPLESASPIAFADYANLRKCMPKSNRTWTVSTFSNSANPIEFRAVSSS